ncbi:MAG: SPOR domain-containing protein [Prevotella sp.]|nr:SPOR domain-containing protein [Prevotella sp.]MCI1780446.1 SPOR domain-containing protein [Prevotella sp.]MCI1803692.1 SPOR domain-containing protein [Prevotella sp.]MCI1847498.1 SPOR domain-containing protein [Prevotella sp.]MCI2136866.1 SPOR domain-containing protein [Prevotella sp.]
MIELQKHIEILLLNNDCVIVPGFGGFVAHHVDARYDESDDTFLPPLRTIGFNPQLTLNDSFLAQSYVDAYDISYPEALTRIENEVCELKQDLADNGKYELNNIGTLSLNEDGNYTFEPCEAGLLTPNLYGLGGFEMKPLPVAKQESTFQKIGIPQEGHVVPIRPAEPEKADPVGKAEASTDHPLQHKPQTISIKVSLLRNVAAACIAIVLFLLNSTPLGSSQDTHTLKSNMDAGFLTRIMPGEVTRGATLNLTKKDIIQPRNKTPEKSQNRIQGKKTIPLPYYSIVLASKVTVSNAKDYVRRLHKKGYSKARVYFHKGLSNKVIYGRYSDEQEARHALNRMKSLKAFSDGWILKTRDEVSETADNGE